MDTSGSRRGHWGQPYKPNEQVRKASTTKAQGTKEETMIKIIKHNGKKYRIFGFSHGAAPIATAQYYYPKGVMKGWHTLKNLSIRRRLAIKLGK